MEDNNGMVVPMEMETNGMVVHAEVESQPIQVIPPSQENVSTSAFYPQVSNELKPFKGGTPKMIITDQDPAMEKAISEVLPDTFHRYCSWHILRKFFEKLDAIKYRDHYDDFRNCIYSSENGEDFDFKCRSILAKSELSGHNWLQSIYEIRFRWFNRSLLHKRHEELISDHSDINEKPKFKCPIKMEKQMADIYTRKYYYMFQDQLWESYNYNLEVTTEGKSNCILKVMREDHEDGRAQVIMYDKSKDFAPCSCKLFESAGVPCRHVLAFLHKVRQLHKLPDQYILKRWTKSSRSEVVMDKSDTVVTVRKTLLEKRGLLFQQYSHVIDSVVLSEEASQLFHETMDSWIEKIRPLLANFSSEDVKPCAKKSSTHQTIFREPDEIKTKGMAK
ncbi:protein FAR1-RELATED SEQUENCE 5-like [Rosa chinensis]|uniref:protein FAR1-RELATED SEQUENCE 5-like n=1 Tax=Rosa chinensis TaxID=74649 RepID=UPI000D0896FD|nr:protein FAR1-RELATED SEQUENCE 5-like [Rosa chinensis]